MENKNSGFFKVEKKILVILGIVLAWDIFMFLPPVYNLVCADGTAVQCWLVGIELVLAPGLALYYGLSGKE